MTTLKRIAAILLVAGSLQAETVYLAKNGKTYHESTHCLSLSRSKNVLKAERADAEKHGLKACGICYRKVSAKKESKNSWAVSK